MKSQSDLDFANLAYPCGSWRGWGRLVSFGISTKILGGALPKMGAPDEAKIGFAFCVLRIACIFQAWLISAWPNEAKNGCAQRLRAYAYS